MTGLDAALASAALGLTLAGAALGLRACARRGVRAWVVHVVGSAAMVAMLLPADLAARLGGPTPAQWPLLLAVALTWTTLDAARSRLAASRRLTGADVGELLAAGRGHTRESVDLAAMTLLLLTTGTAAVGAGLPSTALLDPHGGHLAGPGGHGSAAVLVLAGWALSLLLLAADRRTRDRWGLAGSAGMLGGMALMAVG